MYGRDKKCILGFDWNVCLEELGLDGRIILTGILKTRITYVDSSGS